MAGSLIKIQEEIVSSAVATVELGGTNWDSSYDVYMVKMNNVQCATDNKDMRIQLKNGATTLTPYSRASKDLRPDIAFTNNSSSGATRFDINNATGNATAETGQGIFYLFNFNNASEYSFITYETNYLAYASGGMIGQQGGGVVTQASACDTIVFYWESASNFSSGTFTLYGLKK